MSPNYEWITRWSDDWSTTLCYDENSDQHSKDYSLLKECMRPGHSDYPAYVKYHGYNDVRGGGHFSGRLTAPIVFAGSVAKQILRQKGLLLVPIFKALRCL